MAYWRAKSDLEFMIRFRDNVAELFRHEDAAAEEVAQGWGYMSPDERKRAIRVVATQNDGGYQEVRGRIAVDMARVVQIGWARRIPMQFTSYPAPVVGGPIIPVNIFESVLFDPSHGGIERQVVVDTLNRTVGACAAQLRVEFWRLFNPLYWLWSLLVFVLRIPFRLLEAAGFDIGKIEDNLWARLFKVGEVVLIAYLLARWGLNSGT
jgi:hypothetical protein